MAQDSGLMTRGLFLLGLMALLVTVLLTILFRQSDQVTPPAAARPDVLAASFVQPAQGFPGTLGWPVLAQMPAAMPSNLGWEVRYNAAATLARLGRAETPWPILVEMLDEDQQMRNFLTPLPDGQLVPDEAAARLVTISAMKAVSDWHRKQTEKNPPTPELLKVQAAVDKLALSSIPDVKIQAEKTRTLFVR